MKVCDLDLTYLVCGTFLVLLFGLRWLQQLFQVIVVCFISLEALYIVVVVLYLVILFLEYFVQILAADLKIDLVVRSDLKIMGLWVVCVGLFGSFC